MTSSLRSRFQKGISMIVLVTFIVVHLVPISAAPTTFTWEGLVVCLVLFVMTGMGVTVGYHRLITHGSFETYRAIYYGLTMLGLLSGEGPATIWVPWHRKHHKFSDKEGDPHSPTEGGFWAHMLWMLPWRSNEELAATIRRYGKDLTEDPIMMWISRYYFRWHILLIVFLAALGAMYGGWHMAKSFVVWGYFVRMVLVLHITWAVNSATHLWGYRNYKTPDDSRNLWWVGLLAFGEGWHNNHHAYQRSARHGHRWWEIDLSYYAIWFMEKIGLAWNVQRPPSM
ncbi:MAG TPA: fatty acid desaturase [Candidatus Peribacteraceae bacterium]|nr:fatty acid desaturase [Candidatus Peribacteraceae bacterium]